MDHARVHLISTALPIFGKKGFEGASTRELAKAAGRPMSAITYHFSGKEGLYLACAEHIRDTLGGFIAAAVDQQHRAGTPTPEQAKQQLAELFRIITAAMLGETADIARFMLREQQEPTQAFDIIYTGIMGRVLGRMVELLKIVADERLTEVEVRLRVISLMGQVLVFRMAHAALLRLTGWENMGAVERDLIDRAVQDNLRCILDGLS
ncbi:TetR family transcriptional regulator [Tsuneonella deserti]|uniref:TetR family transcriptional regulator n=1 Tax=Tsuneonella deserti TaxID=2035528 RepID=A0ABQ1S6R7_9SPHN|nr:CerR family C-terminal domain-containing protein [Tsuneonella deserti]GGD91173.1 TetR family transcriptional regulator [Tsuneonella deserti]